MKLKRILVLLSLALLLAACQPPRTSEPTFISGTLQLAAGEEFSPETGDVFTATAGETTFTLYFTNNGLTIPEQCYSSVIGPRAEIRCAGYLILSNTVTGYRGAIYAAGNYGGLLTRQ